jgi:hypothetical protein
LQSGLVLTSIITKQDTENLHLRVKLLQKRLYLFFCYHLALKFVVIAKVGIFICINKLFNVKVDSWDNNARAGGGRGG